MRIALPLLAAVFAGCSRSATLPPPLPDEFRGHWSAGFETSAFVPCAGAPPSGRISVDWDQRAYARALERWPRVPERDGVARYYVRWRGALRGPAPGADTARGRVPLGAGYGHLAASMYEFHVIDVLEMRAPRRGDCAR